MRTRRRLTDAEKLAIVRESEAPGAKVIRFVDRTRLDRYSVLAPAMTKRLRSNLSGQEDAR